MENIRKNKIIFFEKQILDFFELHGRKHLPWRKKNVSAYEVWVSEIMLQQTQVNRVIEYYNKFMIRFPDVDTLAEATWEDFLPYYAGLGYYRRGRNMLRTAQTVVQDFAGEFPRDKKQLMSLPGIGDYTASAILSFAYHDNHLAFDTNLQKVFGRYLYGNKKADVDRDIVEKFLSTDKATLNGAVMDFANDICTNTPKCDQCPLAMKCVYAMEKGKQELAAQVRVRHIFPTKSAQVFLWLHKDHKEYYSADPDSFQIFVLPAKYNTRETIKDYFRLNYGLELAVRPPHRKEFVNGLPTLFVNAQILLGEHEFAVFKKEEVMGNR